MCPLSLSSSPFLPLISRPPYSHTRTGSTGPGRNTTTFHLRCPTSNADDTTPPPPPPPPPPPLHTPPHTTHSHTRSGSPRQWVSCVGTYVHIL